MFITSINKALPANSLHQKGFSLIEVLITLVIVSVSIVALAILQLKNNARVSQASQAYLAEKFMGNLLTEISSSHYNWYSGAQLKSDSPFFKKASQSFPNVSKACTQESSDSTALAKAFLSCWSKKITETMAVDDELLKNNYIICQSKDGNACSSEGSLVLVQMAWYSKECDSRPESAYGNINSCVKDSDTGIRLYKVAIQP